MHYSGPQIISSCPNNTVTGGNMYSSGSTHCCAMRSGQGSNMNSKSKDDIYQSRVICLHAFSDLTHVSPAMFVYLLRECYICGTKKATFKFRVLQQQVLNALRNSPQPEPAVFIVQCLYILPLLGYPYTEGFSHLLISSYRRLQTKDNLSNSFESKRIASQLFLNILNHLVPHEERILIKLMEAFDLKLKEIAEVICGSSEVNDGHIDSAKTYLGHYIYKFIESQSYMTAVTLLEHFSICESVDSSLSFLDKLIQANQFKVAEKWAILMGKPMIRLLIKKYVEMNKPKNAYDMIKANNLKQEFSDVCQLYEQSSLKKLEDIVLHESPESSHSFLDRMIQNKQYKAAEKWAILMGKPMICLLIKRYVDMSMLKHAYLIIKANDLHEEFADVQHLYKQCLLKKLAEKGCWDVAEFKTNKDRQLLDYLVYLALEAGYHEKVEELCDRYSLSGFDNSIALPLHSDHR
ncbi:hypothetical protein ZOSMA_419G00040 [Zostera marina]|uniref:Uncharacterized protein n=1 Tax=Zostera marina TaxID=29655 RepID=A0A0K9P2V3_ZOSMR|nr:hypothetical protein ZOSMA_419G00040 [Zostera marina]